jgi:hypothetical protein
VAAATGIDLDHAPAGCPNALGIERSLLALKDGLTMEDALIGAPTPNAPNEASATTVRATNEVTSR